MRNIFGMITALVLIAFLGRGGLQEKPLIPAHAYSNSSVQLANLSLNSAFTVLKSMQKNPITRLNYYEWQQAKDLIGSISSGSKKQLTKLPPDTNVVIIILESFNYEFLGESPQHHSYSPFLNKFSKTGLVMSNHFANGRRSIDAMPAIFAGIPSWMSRPFITSPYQTNQVTALPMIFANRGYHTAFFHGGETGTMFFDVMARKFGFDQYFGADTFPDQSEHDGRWGIFDEPFLNFFSDTLTKFKTPFFAAIFTLSSHHPYTIPKQYAETFPQGPLPIHETIGYTDYALSSFFKLAKDQPWFEKTLFIITADHTSQNYYPEFSSPANQFRVPLIFYHPSFTFAKFPKNRLTQHIDILPTIVDMIEQNNQLPLPRFGLSLFQSEKRHVLLNYGDRYFLLTENQQFVFKSAALSPLLSRAPFNEEASESDIDYWQSIVRAKLQYYRNGLIEDRLIW